MWVRGLQEATTTRLSFLFLDDIQNLALGVSGAGEQVLVGHDHLRQGGHVFGEGRDVDHAADVDAAVADEDADPRLLALDVPLRRQLFDLQLCAPGRSQEFAGGGGRGRGLHHQLGDILGTLEGPTDKDPRSAWWPRVKRVMVKAKPSPLSARLPASPPAPPFRGGDSRPQERTTMSKSSSAISPLINHKRILTLPVSLSGIHPVNPGATNRTPISCFARRHTSRTPSHRSAYP